MGCSFIHSLIVVAFLLLLLLLPLPHLYRVSLQLSEYRRAFKRKEQQQQKTAEGGLDETMTTTATTTKAPSKHHHHLMQNYREEAEMAAFCTPPPPHLSLSHAHTIPSHDTRLHTITTHTYYTLHSAHYYLLFIFSSHHRALLHTF